MIDPTTIDLIQKLSSMGVVPLLIIAIIYQQKQIKELKESQKVSEESLAKLNDEHKQDLKNYGSELMQVNQATIQAISDMTGKLGQLIQLIKK